MKKSIHTISFIFLSCLVRGQAGIGTTTPNSWLDVRGGISTTVRSFTAPSSANTTDQTLIFTGGVAATLSLPDATTCSGRIYWIKNASAILPVPALTISPTGSQTIEGGAFWLLDEPNETVRLASNGVSWYVYAEDIPVGKTAGTGGGWNEGGNLLKAIKKIGTITNFDLPVITGNMENMRLTTGGFLGIGSTLPAGRIHFVSQNNDAGDNYIFEDYGVSVTQGIYLRKSRGTAAAALDLQQGDAIGQFRMAARYNNSLVRNAGSGIDAFYQGSGSNNLSDLRMFSSDTERIHINEAGKTGINTNTFDPTNPEKLKVFSGTTNSYNVISGKGTLDNYLQLNIQNLSNTRNASSDVVSTAANGSETTNFVDMGINSGSYSNASAPILGGSDNAYLYSLANDFVIGDGSAGKDLLFFTGGYALTNEALRITASGNVGVGTSTPADKLSIADNLSPAMDDAYSIGTAANRWSAVYAGNGVIQTSDRRLKTHIRSIPYGLTQLMEMDPVAFGWADTPSGDQKIGLLAQEVNTIIPEVVSGDPSKQHLGMNYADLVPVLIRSIQQQEQQIGKLKLELAGLMKKH